MKLFAEFLTEDLKGNWHPLLGSDGIMPLDARYSHQRLLPQIVAKVSSLNRNLGKGIVAAYIRQGDLKQSKVVYELIITQ